MDYLAWKGSFDRENSTESFLVDKGIPSICFDSIRQGGASGWHYNNASNSDPRDRA
jgi:hypothetical protein